MGLKNRNISSKIKRSKVTDYAALSVHVSVLLSNCNINIASQQGHVSLGELRLDKALVYAPVCMDGIELRITIWCSIYSTGPRRGKTCLQGFRQK